MASIGSHVGGFPPSERIPSVPRPRSPLGTRALAVSTWVLAVVGAWALLLAVLLAAITFLGAATGGAAVVAGVVALLASAGVVAAEALASTPSRRR